MKHLKWLKQPMEVTFLASDGFGLAESSSSILKDFSTFTSLLGCKGDVIYITNMHGFSRVLDLKSEHLQTREAGWPWKLFLAETWRWLEKLLPVCGSVTSRPHVVVERWLSECKLRIPVEIKRCYWEKDDKSCCTPEWPRVWMKDGVTKGEGLEGGEMLERAASWEPWEETEDWQLLQAAIERLEQ